jgi:hypothetical protein
VDRVGRVCPSQNEGHGDQNSHVGREKRPVQENDPPNGSKNHARMTMTDPNEPIWSEDYVRENPKLAAEAIATLQMLLDERDAIIKLLSEKND